MTAIETFRSKAPWIMALLMRDFSLTVDEAAAIVGNLGHESGGFASLQEINPTVKGSKGGYGWPQWTGPRREAFRSYCERNGLAPASDEANYKYLFVELSGTYRNAIAAVKRAGSLPDKVKAFELAFERAGIKHYERRNEWARRATEAWAAAAGKPKLPGWASPGTVDAPRHQPAVAHEPTPPSQPAPAPAGNPGTLGTILTLIAKIFGRKPS